ncbi:MAG: hypothetical protein QOI63_1779 [Thermoplasmata archaeon]|nr:hypothetical protein [Thermoplasmata archaeon]
MSAPLPLSARLAPLGALAVVAILTAGSLGPAHPPSTSLERPLLAAGLHAVDGFSGIAHRLGQPGPLAGALAEFSGVTMPAPGRASGSLDEALARLATDAGRAPAAGPRFTGFDALPAATQAGLTRMVDGVRDANRLLDLAFGSLAPADRAFLRANLLRLDQAGAVPVEQQQELARLRDLASQVDPGLLRAAAFSLLQASEGLPAAPHPAGSPHSAPALPAAPAGTPCGGTGTSIVDPSGLVEVGLGSNNAYTQERVLIVDIGGDDCYDNHPASVGPGTPLPIPLSVIVDLGGDDTYYTATPTGTPPGTTWASGVGIGGIGLLLDRWGNDFHSASLNNEPSNCLSYGAARTWQRVYAQGVGILGVGGIVDEGGDDGYVASNYNDLNDPNCHWGEVYTFAQGLGTRLGLGFLVDDTGNDRYVATAYAQGKYDNNGHVQAQGAAAARGVGLLVDKEGRDGYYANSQAYLGTTGGVDKGTFAYTFAQGSLYGANEPRNEQVGGTVILDKVVTSGQAVSCEAAAVTPQAGLQVGTPCDMPAVALLVDLLGQDSYSANADSSDLGRGCTWGSWAGVSAQGSAPTKGAAALVDLAADETDTFSINSNSDSDGCSVLGVGADSSGQGFGGSFLWDHWDAPPFDPIIASDLAVGVLLRGGLCNGPAVRVSIGQPVLTVPPTVPIAVATNLRTDDPCSAPWAADQYAADAHATNHLGGISWAETHTQGSGLAHIQEPGITRLSYDVLGVGVSFDSFGDDGYSATARADGPTATRLPFVVAQGAAVGGVGALVNLGDVDTYWADAQSAGVPQPADIMAQADAQAVPFTVVVCVPPGGSLFCSTNTLNLAVGVLVDVFGTDTYSQPCPANGPVLGVPYIWGNTVPPPLGSIPFPCPGAPSSGLILGVDSAP